MQIQEIITATGKFTVNDWILEMKQPVVKNEKDSPPFASFKLAGAVRLVPKKFFIPTLIKDEILQGGMVKEFKVSSDFNGHRFQIEGIKQVPWEDHSRPRFSFSLIVRTVEPRIVEWLKGRLGDK